MFINSEKKILNIIQFTPPFFVVLSSLFIIVLLYFDHQNNLNHEIKQIKENFIITKKKEIKHQVEMVEKYILNSRRENKNLSTLDLKNKIIEEIKKFEYQKDRYIFIINYDSKVLVHVNDKIVNKEIFKVSKSEKRKKDIKNIISLAKSGGGYLTYTQFEKPSTNELVDKTSYIIGLNDWDWFIGTGFYHDTVNQALKDKKKSLEIYYHQQLVQSSIITISSVFLMLIFSFYFSKVVRQRFESYKEEIKKNIEEKEEYTKLLNQQSKMASIGEMIGNIAHQWRQPLTVISMSANNMKVDIDLEEVNIDSFQKDINEIISQTDYLSNTIEDFRNFFNHGNEISTFNLKDAIDKTLSLVNVQFKRHNIKIIMQLEDAHVQGIYNEFIQVLINILNNSKDAFEINECKYDRYIFIKVLINSHINLVVQDNAGGVDESVIEKVLEPYITTKHQSQGTGIGLYMTNEIINKHMNGEILIENIDFDYKGEVHKGAQVSISLPLVKK